jgi:hypothetical protein
MEQNQAALAALSEVRPTPVDSYLRDSHERRENTIKKFLSLDRARLTVEAVVRDGVNYIHYVKRMASGVCETAAWVEVMERESAPISLAVGNDSQTFVFADHPAYAFVLGQTQADLKGVVLHAA